MSEDENNDESGGEQGRKPQVLKIDRTPEIKRYQDDIAKIKTESDAKIAELQKKLEDKEKTEQERDELKAAVEAAAQKEFETRKTELIKLVEADKDLLGEDKIEEIKESISSPDQLDRTEKMFSMLHEALNIARTQMPEQPEEEEKPEETDKKPTGVVRLAPKGRGVDVLKRPFETREEAIHELYKAEREAKTPEDKQKYTDAINKFWEGAIKEEMKRKKGVSYEYANQ